MDTQPVTRRSEQSRGLVARLRGARRADAMRARLLSAEPLPSGLPFLPALAAAAGPAPLPPDTPPLRAGKRPRQSWLRRRLGPLLAISAALHLLVLLLFLLTPHPEGQRAVEPPSFDVLFEHGAPFQGNQTTAPSQLPEAVTTPQPGSPPPISAAEPPQTPAPLPEPSETNTPAPLAPPPPSVATPAAPSAPPPPQATTPETPPTSSPATAVPPTPPTPPPPSPNAPAQSSAPSPSPTPETATATPSAAPPQAAPPEPSAEMLPGPTPLPTPTAPMPPAPVPAPPKPSAARPQAVPAPAAPSSPPVPAPTPPRPAPSPATPAPAPPTPAQQQPQVRLSLGPVELPPLPQFNLAPPPALPGPAPNHAGPRRPAPFPKPMDTSLGLGPGVRAPQVQRGTGAMLLVPGRAILDAPGAPPRNPDAGTGSIRIHGAHLGSDWEEQMYEWWVAHRYYPPEAARRGDDGTVTIRVKMDRYGNVNQVEMLSSSGSQIIDAAGLATFRHAHLPAFPPNTPEGTAVIDIDLIYILYR